MSNVVKSTPRYGLAMFHAQVLEHSMVNTLLVFVLMPTRQTHSDEATWYAAHDRFYDVELGKTFGKLLDGLAKIPDLPADLLERLRASKIDRDHLAHRFFREHDTDFMTSEGRTRMIAECEILIGRFREADRELESFADDERRKFAISQEWIEQKVAEMMAEALEREHRA